MLHGVNSQNQYGGRCYVYELIKKSRRKQSLNNSSVFTHMKMESDDIKEGFICPMCMKDLRNASVLQKHFEEVHSDDKALRQIRGMFGKAKRKIMDKIESSEADGAIGDTVDGALEGPVNRGVDPFLWDHQEFGEEN